MITGIEGLSYVEEENPYSTKEDKDLGRDEFMHLFLAQLNHQDPLNPMDTTQFSSQLAQFSTLEQLFNVNENLKSIEEIQSNDSWYQVLDLIGKEIQANSDNIYLDGKTATTGSFSMEEPAECVVQIKDQEGYTVREIYLGVLDPGTHSFEWDGLDSNGDVHSSGLHSYQVSAVSRSGDIISVDKHIKGIVNRVNLNGNEPVIYVNDTPLGMSQIIDVNLSGTSK